MLLGIAVALLVAYIATGIAILVKARGTAGEFTYLLVLGTKVNGTEPTNILRDRIHAACAYLQNHPDVICIVSGYQSGKGQISEAECMYRELVKQGIASERIWMEPKATSTVENLEYTLALIAEKMGLRPAVLGILSTESHLLRAEMFAKAQRVKAVLLPAKTSNAYDFWIHFSREIIMVWYYSIINFWRKRI